MRLIDLTGQRFGRLTVVERAENAKSRHARWRCRCECGNETVAQGTDLRRGHTQSCGCLQRERTSQANNTEDLTGQVFNRLTVLREVDHEDTGKACWLCKCECGNRVVVRADHLKSGHTQSCGCLSAELSSERMNDLVTITGEYANGKHPDYSEEWTDEFRERVRARDGYRCQICGEPQNGRALDVHHIDYDKSHTTMENCITLCRNCHMKTNQSRCKWHFLLRNLMDSRGQEVDT